MKNEQQQAVDPKEAVKCVALYHCWAALNAIYITYKYSSLQDTNLKLIIDLILNISSVQSQIKIFFYFNILNCITGDTGMLYSTLHKACVEGILCLLPSGTHVRTNTRVDICMECMEFV